MKTLFVTGNHPRHLFLVKNFSKFFSDFMWIIERRPININHQKFVKNSKTYEKHIRNFKKEEKFFFPRTEIFKKKNLDKIVYLDRDKINSKIFNTQINGLVQNFKPKVLFSYGCQKINIDNLEKNEIRCFNIHGGILPKYKGVNTNFWPHLNNDSNMIGLTLHKLDRKIDSGDIFYQTSVQVKQNDTINRLSCKAVLNFCNTVPEKISKTLKKNFNVKGIKFKSKYKVYKKKDFKTSDIDLAYKKFEIFINSKIIKKKKLLNIN